MKELWNWIVLHKKKVTIGGAVLTFIVVSPVLARWSDHTVMPALAEHNIFGHTSDLVHRTGDMVEDTHKLEYQVAQAESAMKGLDQQKALLSKQITTNESINQELDRQRSGNIEARELMEGILTREQKTAQLTAKAAKTGNEVTGQMADTVTGLGQTAEYTGKVGASTSNMNERVEVLLGELDRSVKNFQYVSFVTKALNLLPDLLEGDKNPPIKSSREVIEDTAGMLTGQNKQNGDQDEEDRKSGGLLSDLLP